MVQEEKQLLLKDLCGRLPYEVQCHIKHIHHLSGWIDEGDVILTGFRQDEFTKETEPLFRNPGGNPKIVFPIDSIKPYLRPMSSMTDKEQRYIWDKYGPSFLVADFEDVGDVSELFNLCQMNISEAPSFVGWLNAHHFDYCGLIEKGLALEAPEGMYKTE